VTVSVTVSVSVSVSVSVTVSVTVTVPMTVKMPTGVTLAVTVMVAMAPALREAAAWLLLRAILLHSDELQHEFFEQIPGHYRHDLLNEPRSQHTPVTCTAQPLPSPLKAPTYARGDGGHGVDERPERGPELVKMLQVGALHYGVVGEERYDFPVGEGGGWPGVLEAKCSHH